MCLVPENFKQMDLLFLKCYEKKKLMIIDTNILRFLLGKPLRCKNIRNLLTQQDQQLCFSASHLKDNSTYMPRHM